MITIGSIFEVLDDTNVIIKAKALTNLSRKSKLLKVGDLIIAESIKFKIRPNFKFNKFFKALIVSNKLTVVTKDNFTYKQKKNIIIVLNNNYKISLKFRIFNFMFNKNFNKFY